MIEWLRPLLKLFYAPAQGMDEVRERAPLGRAILLALLAHLAYVLFTQWLFLRSAFTVRPAAFIALLFEAGSSLLVLAFVFAPTIALVSNLFERRGSFSVVLQQEYTALASTLFYAWAAANLLGLPLALLSNVSGLQEAYIASSMESAAQAQEWFNLPPEMQAQLASPVIHAENFFRWIKLILFGAWAVWAVRAVFRLSVLRAVSVVLAGSIILLIISPIWAALFNWIFASPFLLLLLFLLLRGYFGEFTRAHRARASFRQNLEAATLNPADASAHYNLGLIHQQRNELDEARKRFERAVEIDPDETDSHYQLGRIARAQARLADAIRHFEQVVERNQSHAQHEIWREIGATYLAAGQFADARDALERFLENRPNDPEGLYLMGRAHAGLGHQREAASSMQACIEAVKTAPAYKYRTEKRWLNEAQQFLKTVTSDRRTVTSDK
jgi:tetratricopeptide (TPR) repeat protein